MLNPEVHDIKSQLSTGISLDMKHTPDNNEKPTELKNRRSQQGIVCFLSFPAYLDQLVPLETYRAISQLTALFYL